MSTDPTLPQASFAETGLSANVLQILEKLELTVPTPIQKEAIPVALKGGDLIGIAQTGTGKTLAFSLPLIEKLLAGPGIGLIIAPTRELALQVEESIRKVTRLLTPPIRTVCLIGGMPIYRQIKDLRYDPRIIIATPGRLIDHLEQRTVRLDQVQTLILDEADRMLDMGFAPQIERILQSVPKDRQTMMFSATMAPGVTRLVTGYTNGAVRIEVAKAGTSNALIRQELCYVMPAKKAELLRLFLDKHEGPVLVFTRTKDGASDLSHQIRALGYPAAEIHSNRSQRERKSAMDGFRDGRFRVLVATDIAARGIDVPNISLVVNYDLPDDVDDYVHRIGRTGRAGSEGLAVSFASHSQFRTVKEIERLISKTLILSDHSEEPRVPAYAPSRGGYSSYGGGQRRGGYGGGGGGRSTGSTFRSAPSSGGYSRGR